MLERTNGWDKFKSDVGAHARIVNDNGHEFKVISNTPIPDNIKQWLTGKGIGYIEEI